MKIACLSDIHGMWNQIYYPEADFLIIAGDILGSEGKYPPYQEVELDHLNSFLLNLKTMDIYKEIIVVAGNHDWVFQRNPQARDLLPDVIYLQDEAVELDTPSGNTIKIYGSPWQPWFYDWAFNFLEPAKGEEKAIAEAIACWNLIPDDTDILVTHGPPFDILDECYDGKKPGCLSLRDRVDELENLKLHVFGHIHHSYGQKTLNGLTKPVTFVNASCCGEDYRPDNPIQVIEIED